MIRKKKIILWFLTVLALLIFEVHSLTPAAILVSYLMLALSTFGHIIFIFEPKLFPKTIRSWYLIGLGLGLVSLITCYTYYDQSLISGFIANVRFYNVGTVILYFYLIIKNDISFIDLFSFLKKAGWLLLILTGVMFFADFTFLNESELTGEILEVSANKLSKSFTNFIAIYWFSKYLFKSNYKFLLFSLLFFAANHLGEIQRFALIVSFLIIGIGILKKRKTKATLNFIIPSLLSVFIISEILSGSTEGQAVVRKFNEASKIFSSDEDNIEDASTVVRIFQTEFALSKFAEHPVFGNGYYRASEKENVIGSGIYFHVSDIGFFGILYSLGLLGAFIFLFQLKLTWKELMNKQYNHYHLSIVLYLSYYMIFSLLTGQSINSYSLFFFLIALVCLHGRINTITLKPQSLV